MTKRQTSAALTVLSLWLPLTGAAAARKPTPQTAPPATAYAAVSLDREGKLTQALPLYRARAEQTGTSADRLRYAAALLRAGRLDDGRKLYEQLTTSGGAALCGSSLLQNGFPALAVGCLEPAYATHPDDVSVALLLIRARAAAGDLNGARTLIDTLGKQTAGWTLGRRIELARWQLIAGDGAAAQEVLNADVKEGLARMFRDSAQVNTLFRAAEWAKADDMLAGCERTVPPALNNGKVAQEWRNAQRELHVVQLRRGISLWSVGKRAQAAEAAAKAQLSDEEYVRSAATVLLVAADLARKDRVDAVDKLRVLAGHDQRFAPAVDKLAPLLGRHAEAGDAIAALQTVLASEDQSAVFITGPLIEILAGSVRPQPAAGEALASGVASDASEVTHSSAR
ncbi:MAG TPA: hypothetical protein VN812_14015 [Candidatus Acidoferrales bacterium]|nr:hypothetical protein [Candidatus Acidoferrales bacterium]